VRTGGTNSSSFRRHPYLGQAGHNARFNVETACSCEEVGSLEAISLLTLQHATIKIYHVTIFIKML